MAVLVLIAFHALSGSFSAIESAASDYSDDLGATITNETLGIANGSGYLAGTTSKTPIIASSVVVYRNDTADANNYTVTAATGAITLNGMNWENMWISVDYQKDSIGSGASALPALGVLLLILVIIFGVIVTFAKDV